MDALDFLAAPDPGVVRPLGLGVLPYTGNARPDQAWVDTCRAYGVPILWFTQETIGTRSQQGGLAGVYDCQFAEARARERGHTGPIAVVVSDGTAQDAWDASEYGRGWASVATLRFFPYGALGVCASFLTGASGSPFLVVGEWVPETWGAGRIASQVVGPSPVPDTDLNHVHVDLGAFPGPLQGGSDVLFCHHHKAGATVIDTYLTDGGVIVRRYEGTLETPTVTVNYPGGGSGTYWKDALDEIAGFGAHAITLTDTEFADYEARTAAAKGDPAPVPGLDTYSAHDLLAAALAKV